MAFDKKIVAVFRLGNHNHFSAKKMEQLVGTHSPRKFLLMYVYLLRFARAGEVCAKVNVLRTRFAVRRSASAERTGGKECEPQAHARAARRPAHAVFKRVRGRGFRAGGRVMESDGWRCSLTNYAGADGGGAANNN